MNCTIRELADGQELEWDEYVSGSNSSIYHLYKWRGLIKQIFGHDSVYLCARDNESDKIRGILPLVRLKSLLFGDFLVSMPYFNYGSVVADTDEIEDNLIDAAEEWRIKLGCSHVELRDIKQRQVELPVRTDKVSMILQLPTDDEILWKAIGAKRRAQAKRPIREGVEFVTGGKELLDDFYYVFSINMRDLGTPVYSKKFFSRILEEFPESCIISIVRLKGEAVGAGFLIGYNKRLEIPWASTLRKVNRIGVNMYLYWNILKYAIAEGYKEFDFGRSSKDAGTLKFKKQWGGEQNQLYWYYHLGKGDEVPGLNPENKKFQLAISMWQKLPVPVANILGPQIVKNLP